MLLSCKKVYLSQILSYVFIGYIMFCTFHDIQTFALLILTATN